MLLNSRPLNSTPLNNAGASLPPVEPGEVYTPASLVARVRLGQPRAVADLLLSPPSLVSRAQWGQAELQLGALVLTSPSLKGGRWGQPTAGVELRATALKGVMRWGGASMLAALHPPSLLGGARLGVPQASATQSVQSLVSRLSWGLPVIFNTIYPKSLRGGRIGGASLSSITVIEVDYSFGRLRWGEAAISVTGNALPLSSRGRLGRATIEWGKQCPC